ncbi:MAG: hypothetical protein ACOCRO_07540 [Halanaerobiales bacterium]
MLTKKEKEVILHALQKYKGTYGYHDHESLTDEEVELRQESLKVRDSLIDRFSQILRREGFLEQRITYLENKVEE